MGGCVVHRNGLLVHSSFDEAERLRIGRILVKVVKDVAPFGAAPFDERLHGPEELLLHAYVYPVSCYDRNHFRIALVLCFSHSGTPPDTVERGGRGRAPGGCSGRCG